MKFFAKQISQAVLLFICEHWLIVASAFIVALLIASPLIMFPLRAADVYQGINIGSLSNEHAYITRGKEVLEGHTLGNPMLRENKNQPDYYFTVNEYVLVAPLRLLGLSERVTIVTVYNVYNFVGIVLLILLIYFFVLRLSSRKLLAAATALFVVGGYSIIYQKALFYTDFNIYGRAIIPYISSIAFFAYLLSLVHALHSPRLWKTVLSGALFGVLFYVYFFAWTFTLAFNVILAFLFLFLKKTVSATIVLRVTGIGAVIGLYNVVRIALFVNSPAGEQFSYFAWSTHGRDAVWSTLSFVALCALLWLWHKRRDDTGTVLLLALTLAGVVMLNQQLITGRTVQYNHYYWFFVTPTALISLVYVFWSFLRSRSFEVVAAVAVVAVVFLNTAVGQYRSALTTWELKRYEQQYRPIIDRLAEDTRPRVILTADDYHSFLFTIYTPHDLFWSNFATMNRVPIDRFKDALYVYAYLNRESRPDITAYLQSVMSDRAHHSMYKSLYENIEGLWSGLDFYDYERQVARQTDFITRARSDTLRVLSDEYAAVNNPASMHALLRKYGVTYVVWDKNKYPEWNLSWIRGLSELASANNIFLYRIE